MHPARRLRAPTAPRSRTWRGAARARTARRRRRAGTRARRTWPPAAGWRCSRSRRPTRQASICMMSIAPCLQQLLENDPVGDVLAGGDADRGDRPPDRARGRGCRRGWSAPRSRPGRSPASRRTQLRSPRRRPRPGWRRRRGRCRCRSSRGRARSGARRPPGRAPTLNLTCSNRPAIACAAQRRPAARRRSRASRPKSCKPGSRPARSSSTRSALPAAPRRSSSSASSGRARRSGSGSRPARRAPRASCRPGAATAACPARLARRSHTAFTTAPIAMWMTPFSGPSQRSWLSQTRRRRGRPVGQDSSTSRPTRKGSQAPMAASWTSLPRPMVKTKPWPCERLAGVRWIGLTRPSRRRRRSSRGRVHGVRAVEPPRGREPDVVGVETTTRVIQPSP